MTQSRNNREGGYLGWRVLGPMQRGDDWLGRKKPDHQRKGKDIMVDTLKERSK